MSDYGQDITEGARVELSPSLDLWMRGARFGRVVSISDEIAVVEMDHRKINKYKRILVEDLKRIQ